MKYNVIRSFMHFEYAEVEADSEKEAIELAKELDDWETDANAYLTEDWIYEVFKADDENN